MSGPYGERGAIGAIDLSTCTSMIPELSERITQATGLPASTTATAVVDALRAIGARRLAVGTPYDEDITGRERVFFEAAGFEVVTIRGLGIGPDREIGALGFDDVRALASSVMVEPVDALFLSCTNLAAFPLLAELEVEYGIPVVTSNAATLWKALRLIGVDAARAGFGALLSGATAQPR